MMGIYSFIILSITLRLPQLINYNIIMSALKSKKKTQSELALDALIHASKSVASIIASLVVYFWDFHLLFLILFCLPLVYYTFIALQQKAFIVLFKYFKKALKFNKVHNFFDEVKKEKIELPVKGFFDKESPRKSWTRQSNIDEKSPKSAESLRLSQDQRLNAPIYVLPPKQQEEYEEKSVQYAPPHETQAEKKDYERMYLKIRQQYKKSFETICGKQAKREQFQALVGKIRSYYLNRVTQLLLMNRINLKQMKEQLQKHYQVHILENASSQHKPELINVSIDDAIAKLLQYNQAKCFPWADKLQWEPSDIKAHFHKIERIARDRRQIDRFLAPYHPLNQKLRKEVVNELETQINHPSSLGNELAYTVAQIYNDKLKLSKISEQYFIFKQGINTSPCLKFIKTRMGAKTHFDLQIKRPSKSDIVVCNPGDNNLWTLIAFAVEACQRKL